MKKRLQTLWESGKDEEDAVNKAIVDLGDVSEIKKDLMGAAAPKKKEET